MTPDEIEAAVRLADASQVGPIRLEHVVRTAENSRATREFWARARGIVLDLAHEWRAVKAERDELLEEVRQLGRELRECEQDVARREQEHGAPW